MTLDDYIEGTFNPDNPANQDEDDYNDIDEIEVEDPEVLKTN
jgi:hypothetical protein